jgi:hypothetical protein
MRAWTARFRKEPLLFYAAGIPTYVVMAELATNRVLAGDLPCSGYPDALAAEASRRWHNDALASLSYSSAALRTRGDLAVGLANGSRGSSRLPTPSWRTKSSGC